MDRQVEQVVLANIKQQAEHSWHSEFMGRDGALGHHDSAPGAEHPQAGAFSQLLGCSLQVREAGCHQGCTVIA